MKKWIFLALPVLMATSCYSDYRPHRCAGGFWVEGHRGPRGRWHEGHWRCPGVVEVVEVE